MSGIGWLVELWDEDGETLDCEYCDDWDDIHDVIDRLSHEQKMYETIAINICDNDEEIDEDETWGIL